MIQIYGIPKEAFRCAGCEYAIKICEETGTEYEFIPVTKYDKLLDCLMIDRDKIVKLASRAKFRSLRIMYPVIFENSKSNNALNVNDLKLKLNYND